MTGDGKRYIFSGNEVPTTVCAPLAGSTASASKPCTGLRGAGYATAATSRTTSSPTASPTARPPARAADFANLGQEVDDVVAAGADMVHFVPLRAELEHRPDGVEDETGHGPPSEPRLKGRALYSVSRRTRSSWSGVPMSIHEPSNTSPSRTRSAAALNSSLVSENAPSGEPSKRAGLITAMPQ